MTQSTEASAVPARGQALLNSYEVALMVQTLVREQGVAAEALLRGTGLSARQLASPAQRLTLEQELLLYTRVAQHNRDPQLGIRVGRRLSLPNYGMLGHALMGAATVQEVLQLLAEFAPLVSWASHSRLRDASWGGQACRRLELFPTAVDPLASALEMESTFASLHTLFGDLAGARLPFAAIEMSHRNPGGDPAPYRALFGCEVLFGAPRNALYLPAALASRSLPHPQPEYRDLFRDLCRREMAPLTQDRGLAAAVRALLEASEGATPRLAELAARYGCSERTLRRHLRAQGVSYRGLLEQARYREARRYLADSDLGIERIGRRLGYADARSFRTAFRRWAGMTPGAYRRERLAPGADLTE